MEAQEASGVAEERLPKKLSLSLPSRVVDKMKISGTPMRQKDWSPMVHRIAEMSSELERGGSLMTEEYVILEDGEVVATAREDWILEETPDQDPFKIADEVVISVLRVGEEDMTLLDSIGTLSDSIGRFVASAHQRVETALEQLETYVEAVEATSPIHGMGKKSPSGFA